MTGARRLTISDAERRAAIVDSVAGRGSGVEWNKQNHPQSEWLVCAFRDLNAAVAHLGEEQTRCHHNTCAPLQCRRLRPGTNAATYTLTCNNQGETSSAHCKIDIVKPSIGRPLTSESKAKHLPFGYSADC